MGEADKNLVSGASDCSQIVIPKDRSESDHHEVKIYYDGEPVAIASGPTPCSELFRNLVNELNTQNNKSALRGHNNNLNQTKPASQPESELLRMLALRKELDPDAPDTIVLPES